MVDILNLINTAEDFLDYNKIQKELRNELLIIQNNLQAEQKKYRHFDQELIMIIKNQAVRYQKESAEAIRRTNKLIERTKHSSTSNLSIEELESLQIETHNEIERAKKVSKDQNEMLTLYHDLLLRLKPVWKIIKKHRNFIRNTFYQKMIIRYCLVLFPLFLLAIILFISFSSDKISSLILSFKPLKSIGMFIILTLIFNYISNILIKHLYNKQLKRIIVSEVIKLDKIQVEISESLKIIACNYQEFRGLLLNAEEKLSKISEKTRF